MNRTTCNIALASLLLLGLISAQAQAAIDGISGTNFSFTAKEGYISTPEGGSLYTWGYANGSGLMQYPGPTMIVKQGDTVTVTLANQLTVPVSLVFPGQPPVTATAVSGSTAAGPLTLEAGAAVKNPDATVTPGGTVRYRFVASKPGTYMYHSGTRMDLQIPMGLVGALIVRPAATDGTVILNQAYRHAATVFDVEYLFVMTEIDPTFNAMVEEGKMDQLDTSKWFPVLWFLNGRCAPDTMGDSFVDYLPNQPYNCMPMMTPGQKLLMRLVGAGRDSHPFHFHGNNADLIAVDGRLLASNPTSGPDLATSHFTIQTLPGETDDAIFTWTGAKLGWDVYGHKPEDPLATNAMGEVIEDPADHGKPFPVVFPQQQDLAYGPMWSGSPFLGQQGNLPPDEGQFNEMGSYYFMWHSHTEKEMVNNDVFPGGMMTMLMIMPPDGMAMPKTAAK